MLHSVNEDTANLEHCRCYNRAIELKGFRCTLLIAMGGFGSVLVRSDTVDGTLKPNMELWEGARRVNMQYNVGRRYGIS